MRGTRWTRPVAGMFAIALVLAACGGDDEGGGGDTTGETGGGTAITIEGFAFSPTALQVSGEATITITNNDSAVHSFTLDDDSVDQEIPAGETVDVAVNVSETTGFHCRFHAAMTGTLEVA